PLLWPRELQADFEGTPIGEQLARTTADLAALAGRLGSAVAGASEAALRWAYAVYWSRAMALAERPEGQLVPVADLLNHAPAARSAYVLAPSPAPPCFELRSSDAFGA